jgi:hypothetical protein
LDLLLLLSALAAGAPADAQEIRFTRLVDDRTRPPNGSGSFGAFRDDLALEPTGNLAFTDGERVFALVDGQLQTVSSEATHGFVNRVEIDGERVFWSERTREYRPGAIFLWERGSSRVVVDRNTLIPGTECPFFDVDFPDWRGWRLVQGDGLVFDGGYNPPGTFGECDDCPPECRSVGGTYLWKEGALEVLDDHRGPVIEDQGKRFRCGFASLEGSRRLYFCYGLLEQDGLSSGYGLYIFEGDGTHTRVVATGDPIPGGSTSFSDLAGPVTLRRGRIVFRAYDDTEEPGVAYHDPGTYGWDGASLSTILDAELLASRYPGLSPWGWWPHFDGRNVMVHVPGKYPGPDLLYFAKLDGSGAVPLALDVGGPTFVAGFGEFSGGWLPLTLRGDWGNYARAVYVARVDGTLVKVLEPGDEIDGRTVTSVVLGRSRGSTLVLAVSFSEPTYDEFGFVDAIYAAELPPTVVRIDVRPHSRRNRVHPSRRGLVPVALLGSADFDVAEVDPTSLALGRGGAAPWRGRVETRDVNNDGFDDLLARFRQRETGIARGDDEACLSGRNVDAVAFEGCDAVRTPPRHTKKR